MAEVRFGERFNCLGHQVAEVRFGERVNCLGHQVARVRFGERVHCLGHQVAEVRSLFWSPSGRGEIWGESSSA